MEMDPALTTSQQSKRRLFIRILKIASRMKACASGGSGFGANLLVMHTSICKRFRTLLSVINVPPRNNLNKYINNAH
jgi:hypothetical protein